MLNLSRVYLSVLRNEDNHIGLSVVIHSCNRLHFYERRSLPLSGSLLVESRDWATVLLRRVSASGEQSVLRACLLYRGAVRHVVSHSGTGRRPRALRVRAGRRCFCARRSRRITL